MVSLISGAFLKGFSSKLGTVLAVFSLNSALALLRASFRYLSCTASISLRFLPISEI